MSRPGDSTTKLNAHETIQMQPPLHNDYEKNHSRSSAWYSVQTWSKRKIGIVAGVVVALLIIIIVVSVIEVRKNRYPDYTALSYTMVDNIYGTTFFDSFDYFTGYDPTQGFVHYLQEDQMLAYVRLVHSNFCKTLTNCYRQDIILLRLIARRR